MGASSLTPWLQARITTASNGVVEVRESSLGGIGVFSVSNLEKGQIIFDIPRNLVLLSASDPVRSHPAISALAQNKLITSETLLFSFMILQGRDPDNEYFRSLPADPALLSACELAGTNVGVQLARDEVELSQQLVHVNEVEGLETITLSELATAKYNYNSRRFPHWFGLARTGTEDKGRRIYDQTQGCMCPILDLLNHATPPNGEKFLEFDISADPSVLRVTSCIPVAAGQEIFHDYGCVSNDQLLLQFGFCNRQMPELDVFTVVTGGRRYDLSGDLIALPPRLIGDGGYGLLTHLRAKLHEMEGATRSANSEVTFFMAQQVNILSRLCDGLLLLGAHDDGESTDEDDGSEDGEF